MCQQIFVHVSLPFIEGDAGGKSCVEGFDPPFHGNGEGFQMAEFRRKPWAFKAGKKAKAFWEPESPDILAFRGKGNDP
jgi:hypothetical protein